VYQQPTQSYRIGDFLKPKNETPDGDYLGIGAAVETSRTQDGTSQIKLTANLLQLQKTHTWFYTLNQKSIWRLFKDLIAGGILTAESEVSLPFNGPDAAAAWVGPLTAAFVNNPFMLHIETPGEYQNTRIRGRGDAMMGAGAVAPQPAAPVVAAQQEPPLGFVRPDGFVWAGPQFGWQPPNNALDATGGGVMGGAPSGGGFTFMRPHTGPNQTMAPASNVPIGPPAAAAPSAGTAYGNVAELFRGQ
jgi:hypothetical protein